MLTGSYTLSGIPFFSGYYSKDAILEACFVKYTNLAFFGYILGLVAVFCTAFYSARLMYLVFISPPNAN